MGGLGSIAFRDYVIWAQDFGLRVQGSYRCYIVYTVHHAFTAICNPPRLGLDPKPLGLSEYGAPRQKC